VTSSFRKSISAALISSGRSCWIHAGAVAPVEQISDLTVVAAHLHLRFMSGGVAPCWILVAGHRVEVLPPSTVMVALLT
jgi:hypothetical protein